MTNVAKTPVTELENEYFFHFNNIIGIILDLYDDI